MNLQSLIEQFLNESVALTKGSQRVLNDKNLVVNLADAIRDDARSHPSAFPTGFSRTSQKAPDQQLAEWFLENIDKIEKEGYDNIVYSRDGVNSDWIARRYISGSHNWEDLTGVMNMNLCDWYLLKNRNMLDTNHKDLPKFGSVRDVGYYMTTHYKDKLEKIRDAAKAASLNKLQKSVKLVDNDDYRIYTTLNRRAGCALGLGTQWCTANSTYGGHFHTYSNKAMLFQLFPYVKTKDDAGNFTTVKDEDGKKEMNGVEKYQFDAGGPNFMDITDKPANAGSIRTKFPFLYTDLSSALKAKKPELEKAFEELSIDPTLQHEDFKIKTYEIDEEIKKLHKFVDRGYFTDEVRKKEKVEKDDSSQEQPQLNPPDSQQGQQMESIKELARMMIEGRLDEFAPMTPPIKPPKLPPKEPEDHWGDEDDEGESHPRNYHYLTLSHIKVIEDMYNSIGDSDPVYGVTDEDEIRNYTQQYHDIPKLIRLADIFETAGVGAGLKFYLTLSDDMKESLWYLWDGHGLNVKQDCKKFGLNYNLNLDEDDMEDTGAAPANGGAGADLGSMGGGAGPTGGGQYPPGTAPTMPESLNYKGNEIMENVDKDVAAMLSSLKKYDKLTESVLGFTPVSMARPKPFVAEEKDDSKKPWEKDDDKDESEELDEETVEDFEKRGGKIDNLKYKGDKKEKKEAGKSLSSSHIGAASGKGTRGEQRGGNANVSTGKKTGDKTALPVVKTNEAVEADPDVLDWMSRFSKLGNMKGYGR